MRGLWPRKHPPAMPDQQYCTPSNRIAAQALSALRVDCLSLLLASVALCKEIRIKRA